MNLKTWKLHIGHPTTNVLKFRLTRERAAVFAAYEAESWGLHEDGEPCRICARFDAAAMAMGKVEEWDIAERNHAKGWNQCLREAKGEK